MHAAGEPVLDDWCGDAGGGAEFFRSAQGALVGAGEDDVGQLFRLGKRASGTAGLLASDLDELAGGITLRMEILRLAVAHEEQVHGLL